MPANLRPSQTYFSNMTNSVRDISNFYCRNLKSRFHFTTPGHNDWYHTSYWWRREQYPIRPPESDESDTFWPRQHPKVSSVSFATAGCTAIVGIPMRFLRVFEHIQILMISFLLQSHLHFCLHLYNHTSSIYLRLNPDLLKVFLSWTRWLSL